MCSIIKMKFTWGRRRTHCCTWTGSWLRTSADSTLTLASPITLDRDFYAFATSKHEWNERSRHWIKVYLCRVLLALSHIRRSMVAHAVFRLCFTTELWHHMLDELFRTSVLAAVWKSKYLCCNKNPLRFPFHPIHHYIGWRRQRLRQPNTQIIAAKGRTSWLTNVVQTLSETSKRIYPTTLQTAVDDTPQNVSCNFCLAHLHPRWFARLRIVSL